MYPGLELGRTSLELDSFPTVNLWPENNFPFVRFLFLGYVLVKFVFIILTFLVLIFIYFNCGITNFIRSSGVKCSFDKCILKTVNIWTALKWLSSSGETKKLPNETFFAKFQSGVFFFQFICTNSVEEMKSEETLVTNYMGSYGKFVNQNISGIRVHQCSHNEIKLTHLLVM